jgi:hypothetical protein
LIGCGMLIFRRSLWMTCLLLIVAMVCGWLSTAIT